MVLKYLAYVSLRNELTLKLPQPKVKRTYAHCRNELKYFDQHFPPRKTKTRGGPTTGTAAGTPVTILQAQKPT